VSVYPGAGYRTPLGVAPVDRACVDALIRHDPGIIRVMDAGHRQEHGIEVELPFLQYLLQNSWKLVPLVMGERAPAVCSRLAEAIISVYRGNSSLIIASSDLYHGYSYEDCQRIDARTLSGVETLDTDRFVEGLHDGDYQACGGGPIAVAMRVVQENDRIRAQILDHTSSGDVTGDRQGYVVGYGSAVFYQETMDTVDKPVQETASRSEQAVLLTDADRNGLIQIARRAIEQEIGKETSDRDTEMETISPSLAKPMGAFVTLKYRGELRGCVGQLAGGDPLYQVVEQAARSAAVRDPRFPPVRTDELNDLTISVSILGPLIRVKRISDIHIGRHGLYIRRGRMAGLLLPQVATERRWNARTFLTHVCRKAGLWDKAWEDEETEVSVFTAEVFGEHDE
jgi:AmmeMemoRadiSam system protein A